MRHWPAIPISISIRVRRFFAQRPTAFVQCRAAIVRPSYRNRNRPSAVSFQSLHLWVLLPLATIPPSGKKTISIDLDTGERLVLRSPQNALYALVSDWPVNGGVHQQRAIDFCRAWLAGRMPAETVRQAFILAALEAGVTINDDEDGAEASALNPAV
ncbi:DUF982 domain-containing protein [Rhizobium leguminosarum]